MGPRKRDARKRKTEDALGGEEDCEERGDSRKRKQRENKKYIGAHVGIQGNVIFMFIYFCTYLNTHDHSFCVDSSFICLQVGYGRRCTPALRWVEAPSPCFWAPSGLGRGPLWTTRLQPSFENNVPYMSLTQLTSCLMGPT